MKRHIFLAASLLIASGSLLAQNKYPEKPIKLVMPYAPGGSADIAAGLEKELSVWGKLLKERGITSE